MASELPENLSAAFPNTSWTRVMAARRFRDDETAMREFSDLCQAYWFPLYGYARKRGLGPEDAADRTQDFFHHLMADGVLDLADPGKGKLRTFFLKVFSCILANSHDKDRAWKRGGRAEIVELDKEGAENCLACEPCDPGLTPEGWFDRHWALALLGICLGRLEKTMAGEGRECEFAAMRPFLSLADIGGASAGDAAESLGVTPATFRQKLKRLREEFREILNEHVAGSLADSSTESVQEEIRFLRIAVLRE